MRFHLADRILEVVPGQRIRIAKNLTLGEEYLADHFPTFPVMLGVLMLQTLIEAGARLLRVPEDFKHSVIVLREAKNVKYGNFMQPGKTMVVTAELAELDGAQAIFKGKGEMENSSTVSARIALTRYNLRERNPAWQALDEKITAHFRALYAVLKGDLATGQSGVLRKCST